MQSNVSYYIVLTLTLLFLSIAFEVYTTSDVPNSSTEKSDSENDLCVMEGKLGYSMYSNYLLNLNLKAYTIDFNITAKGISCMFCLYSDEPRHFHWTCQNTVFVRFIWNTLTMVIWYLNHVTFIYWAKCDGWHSLKNESLNRKSVFVLWYVCKHYDLHRSSIHNHIKVYTSSHCFAHCVKTRYPTK